MKIATFNLRNLFDAGHRDGYDSQLLVTQEFVDKVVNNLSKTISQIKPDILLAQEVGSEKVFNALAKRSGPTYQTFVATPDTRGIANAALFNSNVETASLPDINGFPVFVEGQEDIVSKNISKYRETVYLKTTYNSLPLHIFGIHLKASGPMPMRDKNGAKVPITSQREAGDAMIRTSLYKLAQARQLRELIDELFLADPMAQIIVLGDYNETESTQVLRMIKGELASAPTTQLTNLCEQIPEEKRYSFMGYGSIRLLDHILVSPSLKDSVVKLEILNENLVDQSGYPESQFFQSDHAPVVLTLK